LMSRWKPATRVWTVSFGIRSFGASARSRAAARAASPGAAANDAAAAPDAASAARSTRPALAPPRGAATRRPPASPGGDGAPALQHVDDARELSRVEEIRLRVVDKAHPRARHGALARCERVRDRQRVRDQQDRDLV